jgi:hypothetical protein
MNEKIQKCFFCPKDAIAICDSYSPTCAKGITPKKPLCEECIVKGVAINIVKLLIPERDAIEKIREAQERKKERNHLTRKKGIGEIHPWHPSESSKLVPLKVKKIKKIKK